MLAPPEDNSPCECGGKLKVTDTPWGWMVTCSKCEYFDCYQDPNWNNPFGAIIYG